MRRGVFSSLSMGLGLGLFVGVSMVVAVASSVMLEVVTAATVGEGDSISSNEPPITPHITLTSPTDLPIGPSASCVFETPTTPLVHTLPVVGLKPTTAHADAGDLSEFIVSPPHPARPMLAARAAAVPPDDPPGVRVRS